MKLVTLCVFVLHLSILQAKRRRPKKHLNFEDCGSDPQRPIHILDFDLTPVPIRSPGKLRLSISLNITRNLPESIGMDIALSKYFFGFPSPFKIPCYNNVGTCHYTDVCAYLTRYDREGCPGPMERRGLPCTCPFQAGVYSLRRLLIRVPKMDGFLGLIIHGEYEATMRLYDVATKEELGCMQASFSIRKRNKKSKSRRRGRLFSVDKTKRLS